MRLGDLDQFKELFDKQIECGATDLFDAVEDALQDTEIIAPETLPIVRELRKQLAEVTVEKEALLKEFAGECGVCANYDKCKQYGKWFFDKAAHSMKEVETFRYSERGLEKLAELLREENK